MRRRRIICSAVLVAMVGRFDLLVPQSAVAQNVQLLAMQEAQLSSAQLLEQGMAQFGEARYEESLATLQRVKAEELAEQDRATFSDALAKAEQAATQRRNARASFQQGEAALSANKPTEAIAHYQAAAGNTFADEGTRQKAREQIQLAQAAGAQNIDAQSPASSRDHYVTGREQYRTGDWIAARRSLTAARDGGYKPRLFEDGPDAILARMDRKEQADADRAARLARQDRQAEEARIAREERLARSEQARPQHVALAQTDDASTVRTDVASTPTSAAAAQALEATAAAHRAQQVQRAAEASQLVDQARIAQSERNYTRALELYTAAVDLNPDNQVAVAGRNEMLTITGRNVSPSPALTATQKIQQARIQEINWTFDDAIRNTNTAISENKFEVARNELRRAENARNIDPNLFTAENLRRFDSTLAGTREQLERVEAEVLRRQTAEERAIAERAIQDVREETAREIRRTVADLIETAQELVRQRRYSQALNVVDQVLTLDPTNDYARGVRPLIEDRALLAEQRHNRETFDREITKQLNRAEEKKIPYDDILIYPADWPDIVAVRDQTVAQERGISQDDETVQAQLDRRLPEVRFDGIGFSDVIDFLRDVTSANIFVNWQALESSGIDRNAPVTARLRDVRFSKALDIILSAVGGSLVQLGYTIDDGVITISTAEDLSQSTVTRVYDIRDLIINIPDFTEAPEFDLESNNSSGRQGGGGGGGGGGSSGGLFGGSSSSSSSEEDEISREELVEQIIQLIQETVAPDSWRDNGGTVGAIRELQGQLIVTQTSENQRALVGLLEQLRETRAIQVTIETRFLTVERNFLEDIGFDWDVTIFDHNQEGFGPITFGTNTSSFTANPLSGATGITLATPGDGSAASNTLAGSYGTFLDDFQVNFLIRATQASQFSTTLTAPRVTLFNGQRAYVLVATQRAYVSDLDPVVGSQSAAFDPEIDVVNDGVLLDVQATVSADRKYVTLTLRPTLADAEITTFSFMSPVTTGGGDNEPPQEEMQALTIQTPIVDIIQVRTSVSVPDGGTLLLGGQTIAGEVEREIGVPILSKIPFVKRLFTNRSMAKDESVLLILVKPTIIIQREIENKAFPLLSTRVSGE